MLFCNKRLKSYFTGFKKEYLRVQLDNNRNMKVSGKRPLDSNRSSRFYKEVQIPDNFNVNDICARFEHGTQYISMPKTIPSVGVIEKTTPTKESPPSQSTSKTIDSEKDPTDAHMKSRNLITVGCSYEDFEPSSEWKSETGSDTLILALPGFKKEYLRVNLDNNHNMKISGERPLSNNRLSRFYKVVQIPANFNENDFRTRFEQGTLYISMPKATPLVGVIEQTTPTKESAPSQSTNKTPDFEKDSTDAHMKPTNSITVGCSYEDFEPSSEWKSEAGSDTLILALPGFKKEYLRVNLDNNHNLKIGSERPLSNNRSSRFYKEVQIPANFNENELRTRFEQGTLYISMPKAIPSVGIIEQTTPTKESAPSQSTSKTPDSEKDPTDAHMKPTNSRTAGCSYEDFEPSSEWKSEAGSDTLILALPGFKKEYLRVNFDNNHNLKISGERPLSNNRSSRFYKEAQISARINENDLRTRYELGTLYISMPKAIPPVGVIERTTPTKESAPSQSTSKTPDSKKDPTDAHMKPTNSITAGCSYEDFEPSSEWKCEDGSDTLILALPGFKKEYLRVQLDINRNMKVCGKRPLDNNRSSRFYKEVQIPENFNVNDICARLEHGTLYISIPKSIPPVGVAEQTGPTKESPPSQSTSKTPDSEKDPTDARMKPINSITAGCSYEDFEPSSEWKSEAGSDTLILVLPGFKKEYLRVNLDNNHNLKISGERRLSNNRSSRFYKEVQISAYINENDLRTRFEQGTLYISMPKVIPPVGVIEQITPTKESAPSQSTSKPPDSENDPTDAHMKPTNSITAGCSYEDFEPSSEWKSDAGSDTSTLALPGFEKEYLRVQLDNNRNMKVSGKRPLDSNRSSRFYKEVQIPDNFNVNDICARFEHGTVYISMPKTIPSVGVIEKTTPTKESHPSQSTSKTPDSEKDPTDAHMKPTNSITAGCSYEDFEPSSEWKSEAGSDTLILALPGFKKEYLIVQLDNNRNMKVSGKRPLDNNRSSRFYKDVQIPENFNVNDICASGERPLSNNRWSCFYKEVQIPANFNENDLRTRFEQGTLYISMPKAIPSAGVIEQTTPTKESAPSQSTSKTPDSEKDPTDAHMKPTNSITAGCSYEDFEPSSEWKSETGSDSLILALQGFKKEYLRVNLDNNHNLKISCERPLSNNRSSRFYKVVQIPANFNENDLRTRFEQGTLYISMPKATPLVGVIEQTTPTKESAPSQNTSKTPDSEKDSTDAHMKPTNSITVGCSYEDFEPSSEWKSEAGSDTLILALLGFKKEYLRVPLDNNRNMKVSGERPLDSKRSSRFYKEVEIPGNCNVNDIGTRFEHRTLYISMPKTIPSVGVIEKTTPTKESPPSESTIKTPDSEADPTDADMKPTNSITAGCSYEDFEPSSEWKSETGSDTLILALPGFKKEHLRVNLDNNHNLKISGERPLSNNKSSRFYKEVQISANMYENDLRTRFEQGTLYISMPKAIALVGVIEQTTPTKESAPSQSTSKTLDSEKDPTDAHMKPTISITTISHAMKKEATSTDAEKRMSGSKGDVNATTYETKKKEEEEKNDETRKTSKGSSEMEASRGLLKESNMRGGGLLPMADLLFSFGWPFGDVGTSGVHLTEDYCHVPKI
ncbi:hypothetical protein MRB53_024206 [Persea americana]|uniref:Uncharacterized protein n=1 Tax=Persea americana TaxID=3435 RepID=A0ACC2LCR9_PERAE|nr:hypothetical protein MRB53_024206 [Persea americana]